MVELTYYIENTLALELALEKISDRIACFVTREYIEMNYSKITIQARIEDFNYLDGVFSLLG
jgi:hypothetical protein